MEGTSQDLERQQTEFDRTHNAEVQGLEQQLKRTHEALHALVQQVEDASEPRTVQPPLCRLPGCWEPVHHKENGRFHNYCRRLHARQDSAIQDDVDQPTLRFEGQKLKDNDTLIQNPELSPVSRQQLFGNTPVQRVSTTPPGYQGGRGGQLTQERRSEDPTRRQPTYRNSPRQFQHEDQRIRGNEVRGNDLW